MQVIQIVFTLESARLEGGWQLVQSHSVWRCRDTLSSSELEAKSSLGYLDRSCTLCSPIIVAFYLATSMPLLICSRKPPAPQKSRTSVIADVSRRIPKHFATPHIFGHQNGPRGQHRFNMSLGETDRGGRGGRNQTQTLPELVERIHGHTSRNPRRHLCLGCLSGG